MKIEDFKKGKKYQHTGSKENEYYFLDGLGRVIFHYKDLDGKHVNDTMILSMLWIIRTDFIEVGDLV